MSHDPIEMIIQDAAAQHTLRDALGDFLDSLRAAGRSTHTIRAYERDLLRVIDVIESARPGLLLSDLTSAVLDAAMCDARILHARNGPRSPSSLHRIKAEAEWRECLTGALADR